MKVYVPLAVTPAILVEHNAPVSPESEWASATAYSTGALVQRNGQRRYEALAASTNAPPESNPDKWLDLGATNPWRPFDGVVGSQAEGAEEFDEAVYNAVEEPAGLNTGLAYQIAPGRVWDTLVVLGLQGRILDVVVRDGDEAVLFARRFPLDGALPASNWWQYYFAPVERLSQVVVCWSCLGQMGADATLSLSVVAADGGTAKVGNVLIGQGQWIGDVVYGGEVGDVDFSRIEEDEFGAVELAPGDWSARADLTLVLPEDRVPPVFRLLGKLRATAAVWVADPAPAYSPAVVYGLRRRFAMSYQTAGTSFVNLSLRGLV